MELTTAQIDHIKFCCEQYKRNHGTGHDECTRDLLALVETVTAQRERIDKLEEALRLNLGVGPDDPILLTPMEREVVELREKLADVTKERDEAKKRNVQLQELESQTVRELMALATALGHEGEPASWTTLNTMIEGMRADLRTAAGAQRIAAEKNVALQQQLTSAQALLTEAQASINWWMKAKDEVEQSAQATIQRLEERNALLEEYQKACHGMEDNIQRGIDENEALQQRLATVEGALKKWMDWYGGKKYADGDLPHVYAESRQALAPAPGGQEGVK